MISYDFMTFKCDHNQTMQFLRRTVTVLHA